VDTDIVVASAKAYMQALNKALASKEDNNSSSSLNIAEGANNKVEGASNRVEGATKEKV
jgi:hypothetical protein